MTGTLTAPRTTGRWRELWRYRELLRRLVLRNLKVKYQRSLLGFAWTLLNPLLTVAVLVLVFSHIVRIRVDDYWAFLLSGYFVWNFFAQMANTGTYIFAEHAALRRSVAFPGEILILGATLSRLVEFAVELAIAIAALALFHHHGVPASFSLVPVLILLQVLLALGLVMPLATLSVFYTDVQHALPIVLMLAFYLSPVFYPASLVPDAFRDVYLLNPVASLLTLWHAALFQGVFPPVPLLAGTAAAALVLFGLGYVVFRRYQPVLAEIV